MKILQPMFAAVVACAACTPTLAAPLDDGARAEINALVDKDAPEISRNAIQIWKYSEVGFNVQKSSALLQDTLRKASFTVRAGVAGMPTAFVASYRTGPGPVIAILAEMDALPGISQQADKTTTVPIPGAMAGHACGHNLLGAGAVGAAIAVRRAMEARHIQGEIRVYGAPAEEGGGGKVYMVREGLFKDVDVVLHWHPGDVNAVPSAPTLALIMTEFTFHGVSSHAAMAPERGRSALEGQELMDVAVAFMRQHTLDGTRIHSVIVDGGKAANVVPARAESTYFVRNVDLNELRSVQARLESAAKGAAVATGTTVSEELVSGVYPLLINDTLNQLVYANLNADLPELSWTEDETRYAKAVQAALGATSPRGYVGGSEPLEPTARYAPGSTDVGDISYTVPTVGLTIETWPSGTPAHTWASTGASGASIGTKGAVMAAKVLAASAVQLMGSPTVIADAKAELRRKQGDNFSYTALLGDRAPSLNYTDAVMKSGGAAQP